MTFVHFRKRQDVKESPEIMRILLIIGAVYCCLLAVMMIFEMFGGEGFGDVADDVMVILSFVPLVVLAKPELASNKRAAHILAALVELFVIGLALYGM